MPEAGAETRTKETIRTHDLPVYERFADGVVWFDGRAIGLVLTQPVGSQPEGGSFITMRRRSTRRR